MHQLAQRVLNTTVTQTTDLISDVSHSGQPIYLSEFTIIVNFEHFQSETKFWEINVTVLLLK